MIERTENDGIVTLRLAHGKVSALDLEFGEEIRRQLEASLDARAVILTGTGSSFCAGVDLFRMTGGGEEYVDHYWPVLTRMFAELFEFPRPVVAAANGHAIAGGCLIVAACDWRLMSGGRIGVPELLVGVPFPAIAMDILKFAAGRDAQWLAYSGATLQPEEARQRGLIDEVVAPGDLLPRANEVAEKLAAIPAESFRITKLQLRRGTDLDYKARAMWLRPEVHAHIREYLARTVGKK